MAILDHLAIFRLDRQPYRAFNRGSSRVSHDIIGAILSITIIMLPLGVPLILFGFLLILRGLF
jgi:hypothetical protein